MSGKILCPDLPKLFFFLAVFGKVLSAEDLNARQCIAGGGNRQNESLGIVECFDRHSNIWVMDQSLQLHPLYAQTTVQFGQVACMIGGHPDETYFGCTNGTGGWTNMTHAPLLPHRGSVSLYGEGWVAVVGSWSHDRWEVLTMSEFPYGAPIKGTEGSWAEGTPTAYPGAVEYPAVLPINGSPCLIGGWFVLGPQSWTTCLHESISGAWRWSPGNNISLGRHGAQSLRVDRLKMGCVFGGAWDSDEKGYDCVVDNSTVFITGSDVHLPPYPIGVKRAANVTLFGLSCFTGGAHVVDPNNVTFFNSVYCLNDSAADINSWTWWELSPLSGPERAYHSSFVVGIAATPAPTLSPTTSPTFSPTTSPTFSPTTSPTLHPTTHPTLSPSTSSPTRAPTFLPTAAPSTSAPTYLDSTPTHQIKDGEALIVVTLGGNASSLSNGDLAHVIQLLLAQLNISSASIGPNGITTTRTTTQTQSQGNSTPVVVVSIVVSKEVGTRIGENGGYQGVFSLGAGITVNLVIRWPSIVAVFQSLNLPELGIFLAAIFLFIVIVVIIHLRARDAAHIAPFLTFIMALATCAINVWLLITLKRASGLDKAYYPFYVAFFVLLLGPPFANLLSLRLFVHKIFHHDPDFRRWVYQIKVDDGDANGLNAGFGVGSGIGIATGSGTAESNSNSNSSRGNRLRCAWSRVALLYSMGLFGAAHCALLGSRAWGCCLQAPMLPITVLEFSAIGVVGTILEGCRLTVQIVLAALYRDATVSTALPIAASAVLTLMGCLSRLYAVGYVTRNTKAQADVLQLD